ncbi:hypothetical protein J7I80_13365 [Bacillus sp. ISL-41]|uniref:hypothetical protein n=1 Tax=Bacillus sp. ISL-41 TaxID=2819127 RepID=UPI001BED20F1|nr:hypothetical protein [Bacillus sp. ISL-41]MBT2643222.1 hypothetical protein [Bacillus sp. ISL-41]
MSTDKDSRLLRRWIIILVSFAAAGALFLFIDITWIKKTLSVIMLLIGFVAAGSVYEFYESWLNKLDKKSDKR